MSARPECATVAPSKEIFGELSILSDTTTELEKIVEALGERLVPCMTVHTEHPPGPGHTLNKSLCDVAEKICVNRRVIVCLIEKLAIMLERLQV